MFDAMSLTSARGVTLPLRQVFVAPFGMPSGTGECAIPRLLHAANRTGIRPVGLAEAWWGPPVGKRVHGQLQPPCERKCLPILGHLLCGLEPT